MAKTSTPAPDPDNEPAKRFESLNERQKRGVELFARAQIQNGMALPVNDETTLWFSQSDPTRVYHVERQIRNRRGTLQLEYRCECEDFKKQGALDCKHIFAEKLRRGEHHVRNFRQRKGHDARTKASRRPARKRQAYDGRAIRSAHRSAKRILPERIPELTLSLKLAFDSQCDGIIIPSRVQRYRGGKKPAPASTRAAAIVMKIACGLSASEMMPYYDRMISDGFLNLRRPPNEDTFSDWINDERLTPILREFLRKTALPFREREIGAIIDSSKISQLMTAHQKSVEYDVYDKRPSADWMKCHALVGVETLVVMAVEFSGIYGQGTHDVNFLQPLVESAIGTFPLEYLLGDKAYLTEHTPTWLAERGIKAVVPIKKRWFRDGKKSYSEALTHLVEWFDLNDNRDFHDVYRLRSKVECLFSVLKRTADGYCWSRGRRRRPPNGNEPCTAWINELLCKFIYINLRSTVNLEAETGIRIDYRVPSRRYPAPDRPLLFKRAA